MIPDYTNGIIALHNTDCMEIMAEYPDNYFDLAVVDPPYGIGADRAKNGTSNSNLYNKKWDSVPPDDSYFKELSRVSKEQIIWGANHFLGLSSPGWIVWDKGTGDNSYADCELAYSSFNRPIKKFFKSWVGANAKNNTDRIHPTEKPVKLYDWIFHNYSEPGQKILDTHLGSGSSAIAAHYFGIGEFVGCEIDEDYFNDACKRIEQQTAQLTLGL